MTFHQEISKITLELLAVTRTVMELSEKLSQLNVDKAQDDLTNHLASEAPPISDCVSKLRNIYAVLIGSIPCSHENADTNLGNGKIWAKCEDCGVTFAQERWEWYKGSASRHEKTIEDFREVAKALGVEL